MIKRFLGAVTVMALLGLSASCGQDAGGIEQILDSKTPVTTEGVFATFSNGTSKGQTINLVIYPPTVSPVIEFKDGITEDEWLASHQKETYDFISDEGGFGAHSQKNNEGGGGVILPAIIPLTRQQNL
ncbi:MAG: hypothetical protein LBC27_04745 [Spirochaetaceae bacterium]|jgi:hypothetical protein|nr:hypothetical protein [Spirochaetaceae bacterium]